MNQLVLTTTGREYLAGDMVHGCVYVKIELPSGASGVILKCHGFENYMYSINSDDDENSCTRLVQDYHEYIEHKTPLYTTYGPIGLGNYLFPFKVTLPERIPGSFHLKDGKENWEVSVVYKLQAELTGSEDVQDSQEIIVHDTNVLCKDKISLSINVRRNLPFSTATLSANAYLDKSTYYLGDTAKLNLEFISRGMYTPEIRCIKIALVQELLLKFKENRAIDQPQVKLKDEEVWHTHISAGASINLMKGLRNVMIPLHSTSDSVPLLQTTFGQHIFFGAREPAWAYQCHLLDDMEYPFSVNDTATELFEPLGCVHDALLNKRCPENQNKAAEGHTPLKLRY